jgi:hypothetical protein
MAKGTKKPRKKKLSNSRSARCGRACDAIREVAGDLNMAAEEAQKLMDVLDTPEASIDTSDRFISTPDSVEDQVGELEELKEELQSWSDNLPESLQGGDTGSRLEEAIGNLESAIDTIQGADFPKAPEGTVTKRELEEFISEATEAAGNLESGADEAEGTEFPGMYGR